MRAQLAGRLLLLIAALSALWVIAGARDARAQACLTCRTEKCPNKEGLPDWCGEGPDPLQRAARPPDRSAEPRKSPQGACLTCRTERCPYKEGLADWCGAGPDPLTPSAQPAKPTEEPSAANKRPSLPRVTIDTAPSGALLVVDGIPRGRAPLNISLPPGAHLLEATLDGFAEIETRFKVVPGKKVFRVELRRAPGPQSLPSAAVGQGGIDPALCVMSTASVPPGSVSASHKRQVRDLLRAAVQAYFRRDVTLALSQWRAAYQLDPKWETVAIIAQACREAERSEEALDLYERLRRAAAYVVPDLDEILKELRTQVAARYAARSARAAEAQKDDEALRAGQRAFELDPQLPYMLLIGSAQQRLGQLDAALASYEQILRGSTEVTLLRRAREAATQVRASMAAAEAVRHQERNQPVRAAALWEEAFELEPRREFLFRKAEALWSGGFFEQAEREYERFLGATRQEDLPELRKTAGERLEKRRLEAALARAARERAEAPPPPPPRPPLHRRAWFWGVLGASGLAVASAVTAGVVVAQSSKSSLDEVPSGNVFNVTP